MDLAHALKVALETGKVQIGLTETLAAAQGLYHLAYKLAEMLRALHRAVSRAVWA